MPDEFFEHRIPSDGALMLNANRPAQLEQEFTKAVNGLKVVTAAHSRIWHLDRAAWSVDQATGLITFISPDGIIAQAPVQIIGTYNTQDGTWLWGWDHPSVRPELAVDAKRVLAYGEVHGFDFLTKRMLRCTEVQCWEFTALAYLLCKRNGAYRGPAGSALVFMTFGEIRLSGPLSSAPPDSQVVAPSEPRPQEPESADAAEIRGVIEAFIQDYFQWNQAAHARDSVEDARSSYDMLMSRYCGPGFAHQPISYGSDSMHQPGLEKIVALEIEAAKALVKTTHSTGDGSFSSNYEYYLECTNGKWLLRSLHYVDDEGKYESL